MGNYVQGFYNVQRPEKYVGDVNNVVFRSSWERKMFIWCENNPSVLKWGSEIAPIVYWSEVDQKQRRYFPDIWLIMKDRDGGKQKVIVEIKPHKETIPPPKPKNNGPKTKAKYLNEAIKYQRNTDKWKAAEAFAKKYGMKFVIMDEYGLGIKKRPKNGRK